MDLLPMEPMGIVLSKTADQNFSDYENATGWTYIEHPLSYRILATVLHVAIFVLGIVGNIGLIVVVRVTRSLQKPTYCYLISLAYADLIVLLSTIPTAIIEHHIGTKWIFGQLGCSLQVFGNFLGINAGSLSLTAFTLERYVAVFHPMIAQKICTVHRANKIIVGVWMTAIIYCAPWLALTVVHPDQYDPSIDVCDVRLSWQEYLTFFTTDIILFYVIPLVFAAVVYWRIATKLKVIPINDTTFSNGSTLEKKKSMFRRASAVFWENEAVMVSYSTIRRQAQNRRAYALHVLLAVVVVFAVCWLPYRGLLIYNAIAEERWLDIWFFLFAKTLVYVNSAINPILYSFINKSLRKAVKNALARRSRSESDF